ncbi:MAG: sterol carrier protein domain-containing protein, partial [Candidatus Thorarchaeota archaeon]
DIQHWNSVDWSDMMMRVVDFEKYCRAISVSTHAVEPVIVKLEDEMCPWNNGTYKLTPNESSLECERLDENVEPEVTLDALGLSDVIGGLTPASLLRSLGKIECSYEVVMNLDAIFPADSFVSYQRF